MRAASGFTRTTLAWSADRRQPLALAQGIVFCETAEMRRRTAWVVVALSALLAFVAFGVVVANPRGLAYTLGGLGGLLVVVAAILVIRRAEAGAGIVYLASSVVLLTPGVLLSLEKGEFEDFAWMYILQATAALAIGSLTFKPAWRALATTKAIVPMAAGAATDRGTRIVTVGPWRRLRSRAAIRVPLAIACTIIVIVELAVMLLPGPGAPPAGAVRFYSETDAAVRRAKDRLKVYGSPIGWVATLKGYAPESIYVLERSPGWRDSLVGGQRVTLAILIILAVGFWIPARAWSVGEERPPPRPR
jgi:hypothetical protein